MQSRILSHLRKISRFQNIQSAQVWVDWNQDVSFQMAWACEDALPGLFRGVVVNSDYLIYPVELYKHK